MKSIMEQASSIIKAIEKAWISAESPKEFTVKIFEKEEKNFFGMTTKPAKIGIFFSDKTHSQDKPHQKNRTENQPEVKECSSFVKTPDLAKASDFAKASSDRTADRQTKPAINKQGEQCAPKQHSKPAVHTPNKSSSPAKPEAASKKNDAARATTEQPEQPRRTPAAWNETMINTTTAWIKNTLSLMGMNAVDFSTDIAGKNLKLTFTKPLIENPIVEKQLFRSIAHLIMASLRNQYKQDIKDLKVVLIRPQ
jgi:predicted RNA-binding protein Jag